MTYCSKPSFKTKYSHLNTILNYNTLYLNVFNGKLKPVIVHLKTQSGFQAPSPF